MPSWDTTQRKFLRWGVALYLIIYHLSFLGSFADLWGQGHMMDRRLIAGHLQSLVFLSSGDWLVYLVLGALLVLSFCLLIWDLNWIVLGGLFFLHLSLLNANPTIIHEPHEIVQLMILVLALQWSYPEKSARVGGDPMIGRIWMAWVFFYYFLSGLKKLPDPNWLHGQALAYLVSWPGLGRGNAVANFFGSMPGSLKSIANYSVLALELSSPLAFFFYRFRLYWIAVALLMHAMILVTLDLGYFSLVMAVALLSCCDSRVRSAVLKVRIRVPVKG